MKKILTLALAMAVVLGGIATNSVTVKACEWDPDCHYFCPHGPNSSGWVLDGDLGVTWDDTGSSDTGSSDTGSSDTGSSDNGGSDSGSYDEPSYSEPSYSEPSYDEPVYSYAPEDNGNSYNSGTTYDEANTAADTAGNTGAPAGGVSRRGSYVTVPGFEEARHLFQKDKTWYAVLHKGQEVATIAVVAADGHEVTYDGVGMKQLEDGRWVINVVILGGTELTAEQLAGYTVTTMKGACANLPTLGIHGVCINGTLVRDIDVEVAAAAAAQEAAAHAAAANTAVPTE